MEGEGSYSEVDRVGDRFKGGSYRGTWERGEENIYECVLV